MQHTSHLMMIRPYRFKFNDQTAVNNRFQARTAAGTVAVAAQAEFDGLVSVLRSNGVDVTVIQDTELPDTPDAIFPNNWISFHDNGRVYLYPMFAPNRRQERKPQVLETIRHKFKVNAVEDLSAYEQQGKFLEGTGSMVLDRDASIAYACLSPRTDASLVHEFCARENYKAVLFNSVDAHGEAIYHTNVMMCVADRYVLICLESIVDPVEKNKVRASIEGAAKAVIEISMDQLSHFAGNMLQVHNESGEVLLVMSTQAYNSLTKEQLTTLEHYNKILHAELHTIETNGGGSARCMIAEIFLAPNNR